MATKDEISEQLSLTMKLAAQVERMAAAAEKLEQSYKGQRDAVEKLASVFDQINVQNAVQNIEVLNKSLKDMQGQMKDSGKTSESAFKLLGKKVEETGNTISKKFPKHVAIGVAALTGFAQGVRNVLSMTKGITGFFGSFVDGLVNVAASIIAIPFKIFSGLVDLAAGAGGGMNELAVAMEKLRKEFGAFSGPTNHAIIETSKNLKGFSDTGLSAWRVFGTLAQRLEYLHDLAKEMGATFGMLRKEFEDNGGALLAYQKGLGISNEDMKGVARNAVMMGKKVSGTLKDMTKYSYELGEAFELDAKLISRDMSKALSDVKHFAGATVKQIAEASTYARKLGLELKEITGTLDAFETFDTAAENVAKLSQSFGVQVDAFKLMEAQDPASQIDMLRKSFASAGVDASNFNRQQLKLLSTTTGLDEATAQAAFSMKNQGLGLDQVKKKGSEAEKKTLTQAEAMAKLADAIERIVQSGSSQMGGFWDMFIKGISAGLQSTPEFVGIIWNIKRALQQVYMIGVQLGRILPTIFPGLKNFLGGIRDFFDPKKFTALFSGISEEIKRFTTGKEGLPEFMENLKKKFFDFFDSAKPAGKKILDGFKTMLKFVGKIVSDGIRWAADKLKEGIQWITDVITGKIDLSKAAGGAAGELGFLGEILGSLLDSLKYAWKTVGPVLWELLKTLGKMIYDYLTSDQFLAIVKPALPYIAAVLFGPAFTRAILGALTAGLIKGTGSAMSSIGKKVVEGLTSKAQEVQKQADKMPKSGTDGLKTVGNVNKASGEAIEKGKGWGVKDAVALGLKLVAIATALSIGAVEMALAVVAMKAILDAGGIKSPKDVLPSLMIVGAMALAAIPLMFALKLASKVGNIKDVLTGGLIISAAVAIVGTVGAAITFLLKQVGTTAEISAAGNLMLKMSLVFLAMVPLIAASIVLGALATGPQAILLAAAAVGMAVIGTAVAEMAGIAVGIVKELNALKVNSDFQRKIDAFLGIMRAIQAFASTLVTVIDLMTPSIVELISGRTESFTEKVNASTKLIKELVGKKGSGNGIIGIIEVVLDALKGLVMGEGLGEKAKIFGSVLGAVAETMKVMTPSDAFYEAGSSFLVQLAGKKPFTDLATDVKYYMKNMREGIMTMINGDDGGKGGIIDIIKTLGKIEIPNTKGAETVSALLSAISGVMKALSPSGDTLKAFTKSAETAVFAAGPIKIGATTVSKIDTEALKKSFEILGEQMGKLLPVLTTGILSSVLKQTENIDKDQFERIKVAADILKTSVDAGRMITESFKGAEAGAAANPAGIEEMTKVLPKAFEAVSKLQEQLGTGVSSTGLRAFGKNMTELTAVLKGDESGKGGVIGALSAVSDMVKQANALNDALGDGNVNKIDVKTKLDKVARAVGLGGKVSYTVNPSKQVQIVVNLQVSMDVDKVEKVMIMRQQSIIRDRINFATNNPDKKGTPEIPSTYTDNLPDISGGTQ